MWQPFGVRSVPAAPKYPSAPPPGCPCSPRYLPLLAARWPCVLSPHAAVATHVASHLDNYVRMIARGRYSALPSPASFSSLCCICSRPLGPVTPYRVPRSLARARALTRHPSFDVRPVLWSKSGACRQPIALRSHWPSLRLRHARLPPPPALPTRSAKKERKSGLGAWAAASCAVSAHATVISLAMVSSTDSSFARGRHFEPGPHPLPRRLRGGPAHRAAKSRPSARQIKRFPDRWWLQGPDGKLEAEREVLQGLLNWLDVTPHKPHTTLYALSSLCFSLSLILHSCVSPPGRNDSSSSSARIAEGV